MKTSLKVTGSPLRYLGVPVCSCAPLGLLSAVAVLNLSSQYQTPQPPDNEYVPKIYAVYYVWVFIIGGLRVFSIRGKGLFGMETCCPQWFKSPF